MPTLMSGGKCRIYLEEGNKRVFAGALDWPGWCRSGKDANSAITTLLAAGSRYARVMQRAGIDFPLPENDGDLHLVERIPGGIATDFGAPEAIPKDDERPIDLAEAQTLQAILRACWWALDQAADSAGGKELRKGPRGGGRDLDGILRHVQQAEMGYLIRVGKKVENAAGLDFPALQKLTREYVVAGVESVAGKDYSLTGSRGGKRWPVRYFVRRVAWHILDHAWEIEDRQ